MGTIASLTEEGWVQSSKNILAYILSYYILSDAGQTIAFQGNLINLPETYYKYLNDPQGMASAVRTDLERLLSAYFIHIDITVQAKELDKKHYAILLYASVVDAEGTKHELSKITEINSAGLRSIIDTNNYGDGLVHLNSLG